MRGFLTMPRILFKFADIRSIGSDGTLGR